MALNLSKISIRLNRLFIRFSLVINLVVVIAILLFGYLIIINPKWKEVNKTGIFARNTEIKKLEEDQKYLSRLKASLEKFEAINQDEIAKLSKILPPEEGLSELFVVLEALVNQSGLSLDSIDMVKGSTPAQTAASPANNASGGAANTQTTPSNTRSKNVYAIDITMTISGNIAYDNFKILLQNFEKELRIMDINTLSVDLSSPAASAAGAYNISLKTYYLKQG